MLSIFKPTRRHFIRLSQLVLGSSLSLVFSQKFKEESAFAKTAESRVYYISPSGNDANPGTLEKLWKIIQKAANNLEEIECYDR